MKRLNAATTNNVAYPTIALNSADYGIGSVYMAASAITPSSINPITVKPFTDDEIAALKGGASIALDDGMVLALSVNGTDTVYEYDAQEAAQILWHADPLVLNAQTGAVSTKDGTAVVG